MSFFFNVSQHHGAALAFVLHKPKVPIEDIVVIDQDSEVTEPLSRSPISPEVPLNSVWLTSILCSCTCWLGRH